jgi:sialic acid synthase SpsE
MHSLIVAAFLQKPSKALTREQERKQIDRSLYFTKTFETGTKMQRKYWLTTVAESLKANGRENLRGKRVQRRLHEVQDRKSE